MPVQRLDGLLRPAEIAALLQDVADGAGDDGVPLTANGRQQRQELEAHGAPAEGKGLDQQDVRLEPGGNGEELIAPRRLVGLREGAAVGMEQQAHGIGGDADRRQLDGLDAGRRREAGRRAAFDERGLDASLDEARGDPADARQMADAKQMLHVDQRAHGSGPAAAQLGREQRDQILDGRGVIEHAEDRLRSGLAQTIALRRIARQPLNELGEGFRVVGLRQAPVTPSSTSSMTPETAVETSTRPWLPASISTFGMPSRSPSSATRQGRTKISEVP